MGRKCMEKYSNCYLSRIRYNDSYLIAFKYRLRYIREINMRVYYDYFGTYNKLRLVSLFKENERLDTSIENL
jgi:hypothetical protein